MSGYADRSPYEATPEFVAEVAPAPAADDAMGEYGAMQPDDAMGEYGAMQADADIEADTDADADFDAFEEDSDDDFSDDEDEDEEEEAKIPAAPPAPPVELGHLTDEDFDLSPARTAKIKKLKPKYANEQADANFMRGGGPKGVGQWNHRSRNPGLVDFVHSQTDYLDAAQQQAAEVSVEGGKLVQGGATLDTQAATGIGSQHGLGMKKHIFAMTPEGKIRTADPWAGHRETPHDPQATADAMEQAAAGGAVVPTPHTIGFINHSSLAAVQNPDGTKSAGSVAGAGEMMVVDGKLVQVTDGSGHYKPKSRMTNQVLSTLEGDGVDMHDVSVKLSPKDRPFKFGSEDRDDGFVHASARELMSYQGAEGAEPHMRWKRKMMKSEVEEAAQARMDRQLLGALRLTGPDGTDDLESTPELRDPRLAVPLPMVRPRLPPKPRPLPRKGAGVSEIANLFEGMY